MQHWKSKIKNLGTITVGKTQRVVYQSLTSLEVKNISSSCGCTSPTYDAGKKELVVKYTPNPIPVHLRTLGFYNSVKTITVYYKDGTRDVLTLKAKVTN